MIASFHIVEYRKRVLAPPTRLTGQVAGLRFWTPLNIGGDFAWFRDHPGRRSLYPRLKPDFRRWAFYAVWDDESAVDEFLATSETGRRWDEGATETCHFWLRPNRVRGTWPGMRALRGSESAGRQDRPVAHLVRLDLSLRGTLAMWGWAAPRILHHLPSGDELLLGLSLVDRPYMQPASFSVWRTPEIAGAFVHQKGHHSDAVQRVRRSQHDLMARYSTGCFEPLRCEGSWNGRNAPGSTIGDDRSGAHQSEGGAP